MTEDVSLEARLAALSAAHAELLLAVATLRRDQIELAELVAGAVHLTPGERERLGHLAARAADHAEALEEIARRRAVEMLEETQG
jgi:hypothetical protein